MDSGKIIIQSSTFNGVVTLINRIMDQYVQSSSTTPVKAADGSYIASVHYSMEKISVPKEETHIIS